MDKLQPLLTHKFWIAFVGTMVMILVGWNMGTVSYTHLTLPTILHV